MEVDVLIRLEVRRVQRVADSTSMVSRSVTFFVSAMNMAIGDGGAWFRTTEHEQTTEEEIEALVAELQQRRSEHLGQRRQLLQFQQSSAQLSSDSQAWARSAVRRQAEENAQQVELHEELSVARSQLQHDEELVQEVHQHRRHEEAAYVSLLRDSARHARCEREKLVELQAQRAQLDARRPQLQTALQEVNEQRAHEANVCSFLKRKTEELQAEGHRLQTMHMESGSSCHATLELYRRQASEEAAALRLRRAQQQAKVTEEEMERMAFERRMAFRRRMEQRKKGPNDETGAISAVAVPAESTAETAQRQQGHRGSARVFSRGARGRAIDAHDGSGVANVMDIFQQVRTLVGLVSNAWSWSMRTNSTFRQVMPGLVRVHPGMGSETFIMQSYYLSLILTMDFPGDRDSAFCGELQWLRRRAVRGLVRRVAAEGASAREALAKLPFWPPCTVLLAPKTTFREALAIDGTCVLLGGSGTVLAPAARTVTGVPPPLLSFAAAAAPDAASYDAPRTLCDVTVEGPVEVLGAATLRRCRVVPPAAVWGKVSAGVATKGKAQLRLEHCTFQGWKSAAVCFRDDSDVTLKECRFEENPGTCISARNAASITVQQSSLTKNGGPVIQLRDATRLRLSESRLESNKGCGILVRGQAEAFIKSSCLEGHKMSAVAFQHQAKGSVLECRFERNDGAVVLVNGSAEVTVESNVFEKNGKSPPVLEFHGAAGPVKAKIVAKREKDVNGLTHQLSYISGAEGSDWANLDESAQMIRNRAGETNVPYQIKEPMRVGQQHDGEGGTLSGVNLQRGIKRSVLAVKDTAKATVRCNRMKANDGYGILVSDEAQAVMEENVLEEFKHAAIMLEGSASGVARTNTLSNNGGVGIQVQEKAKAILESNRIFQEKQPCIKVLGTSKSTIRQNYLLSSAARTARAAAAVLALDDAEVLVEENEVAAKRQVLRRSDGEEVEPERSPKSRRRNQPSGTMERKTGLRNFVRPGLRRPGQEAPVTDVALRTPTKSFAQIKVLLKLRWLLRLHSACCELDYKMCSLRNIILGMQYVVLQACAEAECDSLFDTKVQQNVGAHLHLESVLDDIADQLYRSLGKAHRAFLEYVASCDPMRSVHFSQIDSPLTPPQVQSNEQLAIALDTTFVSNFLRQSQRETTCTLQELYDDLEALSIPLPEIPPLAGAQNLRAWALAKTKPTPDSRQRGLGEDMVKLAQLDAVLLCAAVERGSPSSLERTMDRLFHPRSCTSVASANRALSGRSFRSQSRETKPMEVVQPDGGLEERLKPDLSVPNSQGEGGEVETATAGLPSPDQDLPRADDPEKGAWPAGPIPTPSSTATHRETTEPGIARVHADEEVPKTRAAPTGVGVAHKERPVSQSFETDGCKPGK
ncbi:unnamed protein product [Durusdinium trenchii]|uniref:Right handed beta helix domain-containing protein n=1 Tax=Durusdinium trenchii TaxID=1381693 RepID=A0ABP0P8X0_9DINO